ncbi:hypothetical protein ACEU6E_06475 [Halorutilales archaeon Cl-col2-1]
MDLNDLRHTQSKERETDSLRDLHDSFYSDAAEYIDGLREERDSLDSPYSDEAQKINDAVQTSRQVVESIYRRRVGKIVKLASLSANGTSVDESGMTDEERELYDSIVGLIRDNHSKVVERLEEGPPLDVEDEEDVDRDGDNRYQPEHEAETETSQTDELTQHTDDSVSEADLETDHDDYKTVRLLDDLPEFVATDGRSYSLSEEDVVVLPEPNADVLVENEVAVEVE